MISKIFFKSFKSYLDAQLTLSPLTVLIGANASGKSNAIEGIRILSWMSTGQRLADILLPSEKKNVLLRGISTDLGYYGEPTSILGCTWNDERTEPWNELSIQFEHSDQGMLILHEKVTSTDDDWLYETLSRPEDPLKSDIQVAYNNFKQGPNKPRITCQNQQAIFSQLTTPARFGKDDKKSQSVIPLTANVIREMLDHILFLDPSPGLMRDYSFMINKTLQENGANLSSVLYELCENQGKKEDVLQFIRALPEQDIRDIQFILGPRNEVMLQLTENFAYQEKTWDAALLSDGTLRVLAIAAALLSAPQNSLVVIEEIDNGVHPSRAKMLLDHIQKTAVDRKLQVLLTTHNPALLDALPLEAIPDVVCCYRDPQKGDSRLIRLSEIVNYPELIAQGPVGELMTEGILETYLKNPISKEQRKKEKLAWLDNFSKNMNVP
jgi:hypothetical protein